MFIGLLLLALPVQWDDLAPAVRAHLPVTAEHFPAYIRDINAETARRVREGELEHMVYFVLQSRSFTRAAPIEPALSGGHPAEVARRFKDFFGSRPSQDPRLRYFQRMKVTRAELEAAWRRSVEFLASMDYHSRGHSSDTRLASSFTVWNAIQVLQASDPKLSIRRVLIIGPGADFAPRTDFQDSIPPQSYQPYAVADALGDGVTIDCADVNPRVLSVIGPAKPRFLAEAGTPDFREYQQNLARSTATARIEPKQLNIVTERLAARYDLIIATNVLLYFPPPQLALALSNIEAMLAPGGAFIHNDLQPQTEQYTKEMGLKWVQARRILIAQGRKAPLFDVFAILRK